MFYVIAFDIHDNKRRRKAVKLLLSYGIRIQYYVFEMILENRDVEKLQIGLKKILTDDDSFRIYGFNMNCTKMDIGNIPSVNEYNNKCLIV